MKKTLIRCPKCSWEPDGDSHWVCQVCNTRWNTFETRGRCPSCGKVYEDTACIKRRGGCGEMSPHADWYESNEIKFIEPVRKSMWFWKNKDKLAITEIDRQWVEHSLLSLTELFGRENFKSLTTITPDAKYFDHQFLGIEEDAQFILERLVSIMQIDAWEMQLMFFSKVPTRFSEGIAETPSDKLKNTWKSSLGAYVDKGLGHKEIWIELGQLKDTVSLIATMAHELSHYKLLGEERMTESDELLTDLTAIAFGFGIFIGNSYFKFAQWTGSSHQGWQMQKRGYLPEQVIAYAMAWLSHYRNEDIAWKYHLNKTMRKYFDQSYKYIGENYNQITWEVG